MMPMLQALDLACVRGDRRLFRGLSFAVESGQVLRVEGANGAGKTSLLRLLAGLGLPAAGEVHWQGRPVRRQREAYGAALVYLGHLTGLKDELTPIENLRVDAGLAGIGGSGSSPDDAALLGALRTWGIERQARLPLRVLSAGQRRRAALARLQLSVAPLWILDEPFTALDVDAVRQLGAVIDAHLSRGGLAVVTSHQDVPVGAARMRSLRLS